MKKFNIIIILLLCAFHLLAENTNDTISINISSNKLVIADEIYIQDVVQITNHSSNNVWIVFSDNYDCSNESVFQDKFLKIAKEGDMRFIDWILDNNVSWDNYENDIYRYFFKILAPSQRFFIIYNHTEDKGPKDIVYSHRILSGNDFGRWKNKIEKISPTTKPSFQSEIISVPLRTNDKNKGL